jgi:hypothetical protein
MYVYGTQYSMIMCPEAFVSITMAMVYLPVFYKLQITSSYEVTIKINYAIIEKPKKWILSHMTYLQFVCLFVIDIDIYYAFIRFIQSQKPIEYRTCQWIVHINNT